MYKLGKLFIKYVLTFSYLKLNYSTFIKNIKAVNVCRPEGKKLTELIILLINLF